MKLNWTLRISLLALFVISCAWRLSRAQDPPRRIEIVAKRFQFTPGEITLKKGQPVVLVLTSQDVEHGLKLEAFNQVVKSKKGQSSQVEFTPTEVGTFVAQCAVFCGSGHGGMKLTIHVTE
ncbi:MAG TPA: cupredoxin domain-containing protein [Acidobacteriaceae bacterium]|nr:cupredoxin domain-containing protein [Acidobacteriaceae bacterium]